MKKHPGKRDIIESVAGFAEEGMNKFIQDHIKTCKRCLKNYESIDKFLKQSLLSQQMPSDNVELRIRRSYREIVSGVETKREKRALNIFQKGFVFTVASITILISIILFGIKKESTDDFQSIPMALKNISGKSFLNEQLTRANALLKENSVVSTSKNSHLELFYKDRFRIIMSENTRLKIVKAVHNKETNKFVFSFELSQGEIYSHFYHHEKEMEYSFKTPGAMLHSIGTEFTLRIEKNNTILNLEEGSLQVKSLKSGEEIKSFAGKQYLIGPSIKSMNITSRERRNLKTLKNIFSDKDKKNVPLKRNAQKNNNALEKNKAVIGESENGVENNSIRDKRRHRRLREQNHIRGRSSSRSSAPPPPPR